MSNEISAPSGKFSLPRMPEAGNDVISRILISPSTDGGLAWALLKDVDLSGKVDGKPILQAFCEAHDKMPASRSPLPPGEHLPASREEPWPDPHPDSSKCWPGASMWIGAALIINSDDPFGWKTDDGRDVLDFVLRWRNDHLFNQLMRMKGAPSINSLEDRRVGGENGQTWVHHLCSSSGGYLMLEEILRHGLDPNVIDGQGTPAIHLVKDKENFDVMVRHGADIWQKNAGGNLPVQSWIEREPYNHSATEGFTLDRLVGAWCKQAPGQDIEEARTKANPLLFYGLRKRKFDLVNGICENMDKPVLSWRNEKEGENATPLGILAYQALKNPTDKSRSRLSSYLKNIEMKDAEHRSHGNIPDIDLVFAALTSSQNVGHRTSEVIFMECLAKIGMDPERARERQWEAIIRLGAHPRFNGKKINETISGALSDKAIKAFQKIMDYNQGKPADDETLELLRMPERSLGLASPKLSSRAMNQFLLVSPSLLKEGQDEHNTMVLDHIIDLLAQEASFASAKNMRKSFLTALEGLIEKGAIPSGRALDVLQSLDIPDAKPTVAKMIAARLDDCTTVTGTTVAAPRF